MHCRGSSDDDVYLGLFTWLERHHISMITGCILQPNRCFCVSRLTRSGHLIEHADIAGGHTGVGGPSGVYGENNTTALVFHGIATEDSTSDHT